MFHFLKPNLFDNVQIDLNNFVTTHQDKTENKFVKKRFSLAQDFNPEECYTSSDNEETIITHRSESSVFIDKTNNTKTTKSSVINNHNIKEDSSKKVVNLKFFGTIIELLSIVLIFITAILSLIEYEVAYLNNQDKRIFASLLINSLLKTDISASNKDIYFILKDKNITSVINAKNNSGKFLKTNKDIIDSYDLKKDFNYDSSISSYKDISVPLEENLDMFNLRLALFLISYISGIY